MHRDLDAVAVRVLLGAEDRGDPLAVGVGVECGVDGAGEFADVAGDVLLLWVDDQLAVEGGVSVLGDFGGVGECVGDHEECVDDG